MVGLDKISEIALEVLEEGERLREVILFQPIKKDRIVALSGKHLSSSLSISRKMWVNLRSFFFKSFPIFIPKERRKTETQFKTILAYLLHQEELFALFLGTEKRQKAFSLTLKVVTESLGISVDWPEETEDGHLIAAKLTEVHPQLSLYNDPEELVLQLATLTQEERRQFLFILLSEVNRPELASHLEIQERGKIPISIDFLTTYGKFSVHNINEEGEIQFEGQVNTSTPSIAMHSDKITSHSLMNLKKVVEVSQPHTSFASYSGSIYEKKHVLETILFLFSQEGDRFFLKESTSSDAPIKEIVILFTSLYGWHEFSEILEEKKAIDQINDKILHVLHKDGREESYRLSLNYLNIAIQPKLPMPSETKAQIDDISDFTWISLLAHAATKFKLSSHIIDEMKKGLTTIKQEKDFFFKQKATLALIDRFRAEKKEIIHLFDQIQDGHTTLISLLEMLFFEKLSPADRYLAISLFARELDVYHHTNCSLGINRSSVASALHKAETAFSEIQGKPFITHRKEMHRKDANLKGNTEDELFDLIYNLYLHWEEPEINAWLSKGSYEKFIKNASKPT